MWPIFWKYMMIALAGGTFLAILAMILVFWIMELTIDVKNLFNPFRLMQVNYFFSRNGQRRFVVILLLRSYMLFMNIL